MKHIFTLLFIFSLSSYVMAEEVEVKFCSMLFSIPKEWQKHQVGEEFFKNIESINKKNYEKQLELYNKSKNKKNLKAPKKPIIPKRIAYKLNNHTLFKIQEIKEKKWGKISEEIDEYIKKNGELKIRKMFFKNQSKKENYEVIELGIIGIGIVEDSRVAEKLLKDFRNGRLKPNMYRYFYRYKDEIYEISIVGYPKEEFLVKMTGVAQAVKFK